MCDCRKIFLNNTGLSPHLGSTHHGGTIYSNSKDGYLGYTFDLKNNETAVISVPNSVTTVVICRIYDSTSKTDTQTAKYSINGSAYKTIQVCDVNSSDGIARFTAAASSAGGDTIVVKNSVTAAGSTGANTSALSKPKLNKTKASLCVGQTTKLKVTNYAASKVTWTSSNKKIATVTSSGKVKGVKAGTCTITAKVDKKSVKCKVTIKKRSKTVK
jgi:uncharacterized protein YjdB